VGIAVIDGVLVHPRRIIADDRGAVLHFMRRDAEEFREFGEVYFSEVNAGAVKAWKRHTRMTQHFVVPVGRIRFFMVDARPDSHTDGQSQDVTLGRPDAYALLVIPPGVWYGFQNVSNVAALIANCADLPHEVGEGEARAQDDPTLPQVWHT
jgi:dTDP-4-dehydrorhamnose 3,5-epimerase